MNIHIAQNIKMLRKRKDITQEQLADFLNLSSAAISKWERGESFPDISLLPVLARFFEVSIDVLLGYDVLKSEEEINRIEDEYYHLKENGLFEEASFMLKNAYQEYGNEYRMMYLYLLDITPVASSDVLLERKEEILKICERILVGCTEEKIRLEAINIRARIFCAQGEMETALLMLNQLPGFTATASMRKEQLFENDSDESRWWAKRNLYDLSRGVGNKLAKKIWFDNTLDEKQKLLLGEKLGDQYMEMYAETKETALLLTAQKLLSDLALRITAVFGAEEDIVRIRRKELECAQKLDRLIHTDSVLLDIRKSVCGANSFVSKTKEFLETAPQRTFARMRKSDKMRAMLKVFS